MSSTRTRTRPISYHYGASDSDVEEVKKPAKRKRFSSKKSVEEDEFNLEPTRLRAADVSPHGTLLHIISNPEPVREALLEWYEGVRERRGMPWRKPYDPTMNAECRSQRAYEVWISEIMLQQTQVATVIPYYNRWMTKYPTIKDLANSDIETVNSMWKGLGYYSRAARLLSGAQKIVKEYNGVFPQNAKEMMADVPGIGRYSAGAISSIAYNQCEPVLDGNVNRLLSRVLALYASPKAKSTLDILWEGATTMVKHSDKPGDVNQALIELGATVCKVRDPACASCPLNRHCRAYQKCQGKAMPDQDIEELCTLCEPFEGGEGMAVTCYPMRAERKKSREEIDVVNVIEWLSPQCSRHFLLVRRPEKGLLAGLHEFPSCADVKNSDTPSALQKIGESVLKDVLVRPPNSFECNPPTSSSPTSNILRISKITSAGDVLHIFSHIRKTYRVQWILLEGGDNTPELTKGYSPLSSLSDADDLPKKKFKKGGKLGEKKNMAPALRWVEYEDVEKANIGTGVLKVWKKVSEIWDDHS